MKPSISVVGLGMMGAALAGTFLRHGFPTTVWNRSAERADHLVANGAVRAATVADALSASTLVVVCVLDYEAVHEVIGRASDALSGRVIVNLTSGTPEQAHQMAAWVTERGADYLDGAIMAIPPAIGQPEATILYSGSQAALTAHQPMLATLGATTYLGDDAGLASLYDLALLGIMWSTLSGFYHAAALVGTANVDARAFAPMAVQWLSTVAGFLPGEAREIDEGSYATEVSSLGLNAAGLGLLVRASQDRGISVEVPRPLKALFERGVAEGHGANSVASLFELIR